MTRDGEFQGPDVESLTAEIVENISLVEGVDPLELQPPLQTVVDLDAVEDVIAPTERVSRSGAVSLTFEYGELEVTIERDDEDVSVRVKQRRSV